MKPQIIWFDLDNTPHVNFFEPIIRELNTSHELIFTLKRFAETENLFVQKGLGDYKLIGKHKGGNKLLKVYGVLERTLQLMQQVDKFGIKISIGGDSSNLCSRLRGKKSITFDDNEQAPNWRYSFLSDFAFWPEAVPLDKILSQGFKKSKLFHYPGFKEDIYLAQYFPDDHFLDSLPFQEYVVVRPENILANYVDGNHTIVPDLVKDILKLGMNVLYLPRYEMDRNYLPPNDHIYIPATAINGLDACYFSKGVFTGAGTLAREAALLGVPSFSFYAGKKLLAVDQAFIKRGKVFFSRDAGELLKKFKIKDREQFDQKNSQNVYDLVMAKLKEIIHQFS